MCMEILLPDSDTSTFIDPTVTRIKPRMQKVYRDAVELGGMFAVEHGPSHNRVTTVLYGYELLIKH